jgi:heat-inducible transcriptional repressor
MIELDPRKQLLLQAIVDSYVRSAEPVGSEWLASNQKLGVRSATIRNELSEMTELGYLRQPHTSAGRVPSDLGYRYYVDRLMTWARLAPAEVRALRGAGNLTGVDIELLLTQTCRVLSSLTRYTSFASPPVSESLVIRQVHAAQMSPVQLLLVVVLEGGHIIHRFVEVPRSLTPAEAGRLSPLLDALLAGKASSALADDLPFPPEARPLEPVLRTLIAAVRRALGDEAPALHMEGTSHILGQPEFRESQKVEPLIRLLEERKTAFESLRTLVTGSALSVIIGAENLRTELHECSLVAARYEAGPRSTGWIGLLGPTRMSYDHAMPVVSLAARALSRAFSRLGVD